MDKKLTQEQKQQQQQQVTALGSRYLDFLSQVKTERQGVKYIVTAAKEKGFADLRELLEKQQPLRPGNKVYWVHQEKVVLMAVIGKEPLEEGIRLVGAHTDSPRLDLKPNPIYEAKDLAMAKTHYYGGIKKYQWVGMPLALHGLVILADGTQVELSIGEKQDEPVFTITDLLPHLAQKQMEKKLGEGISGEGLNILLGSIPLEQQEGEDPAKEPVKEAVLAHLQKEFGISPQDFISAELEVVPAGPAREVGLDRSMIGGYGQDDRACAYTLLESVLELEQPDKTGVALFVDKEEIGSTGSTGMQSRILPYFLMELGYLLSPEVNKIPLDLATRRCLLNSKALSADVNVADDPNYDGVLEKNNAAKLGQGVVVTKYTGVKGKAGASDANAEFMSYVRTLLDREQIPWQVAELGQVDAGGGGTIARFLGEYGLEVVDCGPALLSMHSPFEVVAKVDLYHTYRAYKAFFYV